ncbi:DUF3618 domain-containing protein [Streptomyces sp. NPDC058653]|uniref:DUF3618 domain-containing protein n=1 Tax=Streptomyces sp. NPDC058653 TaxID=3346576 RepID=UPI0036614A48
MSKNGHGPQGPDDNTVAGARIRVEEARERLGDTVDQLAAKADVKGRTQEKAAEVRDQVADVRDQVVEAGKQVRDQVREHTPERVRDAAAKAAVTGKEVATKAAGTRRRHPRSLLLAGGVAVVAVAVAWARRRARKS